MKPMSVLNLPYAEERRQNVAGLKSAGLESKESPEPCVIYLHLSLVGFLPESSRDSDVLS
jgi:hypothetical protein